MLRIQRPLPERYTDATPRRAHERIGAAKAALGDRLFILGHHYQRDEIIRWADARGDSYRLSVLAQQRPEAEFIVFCGVHFMAESADILTGDHQQVILPDLNAGCSMADMADIDEVEEAWESLDGRHRRRAPRADHVHEQLGGHQGVRRPPRRRRVHVDQRPGRARVGAARRQGRRSAPPAAATRCIFFPDQHLGRNTGVAMGYGLDQMRLWDPRFDLGGLTEADCKEATFLLWRGHCSIHQRFRPEHIAAFRAEHPDGIVVVHPEVPYETVQLADQVGSTDYIIKAIDAAPAGAHIAVGTEVHLINRLAQEHPDKTRRVARPAHLPVLDDEPHRPPPPRLGARGARRRPGRQPHQRRPRHDRVGEGGAPADAGDRLRLHGAASQGRHASSAPPRCRAAAARSARPT